MIYKLELQNIYKKFDEKIVLNGINLQVLDGTITTILGGSGSGKSVLMKIMIGLIKKTNGKILSDNSALESRSDFKKFHKKISVLFQNNALFDGMNIEKNILFPFINDRQYDKATLNTVCDDAIISVGLETKIRKSDTSELSGGMQKRVALARSIITKPEIIFLDEPTSGLDVENSEKIFKLIKNLSTQYGITFIIITHDVFLSPLISDKMIFLEGGKTQEVNLDWIEKRFRIKEQIAKS